ncbi:hypothetical protein D3C71_844380 [compost metagenome]
MSIESEMIRALESAEVKSLLSSHGSGADRAGIERDLRQRQPEVELELSKATADWNEALAEERTVRYRVESALAHTGHKVRLGLTLFLSIVLIATVVLSRWPGWRPAQIFIDAWNAPFSSGWIVASLWVFAWLAAAVLIYEIVFFNVVAPRRRVVLHDQFGTGPLEMAVRRTAGLRQAQLEHAVRDHVTEILNTQHGPIYAGQLRVRRDYAKGGRQPLTVGSGLAEVGNSENEVSTSEWKTLLRLFSSLPGASLGISGPRGVGKSTLMASFCNANPTIRGDRAISVATSAPVEYDSREFLLHIFAALCRRVIQTEGEGARFHPEIDEDEADADRRRRRLLTRDAVFYGKLIVLAGAVAFSTGAVTGAAGLQSPAAASAPTAEATPASSPATASGAGQTLKVQNVAATGAATASGLPVALRVTPSPEQILTNSPLVSGGLALTLFGFVLIMGSRPPFQRMLFGRDLLPEASPYVRDSIAARAKAELRNIAFQRTYTTGWGGGLKLGVGLETSRTGGVSIAERTESLPELVERFRAFVERVADHYNNVVIIGIDELDKLKTAHQAEAFLNGLKSIFGINRCFYLVSVSEHALAAFERRGLGFRDAFDSALDDIIQLDFLTLEQSRTLLNRRILRLPDPFLQVCHMFAGGLPRDLIRQGRTLLDIAERSPKGVLTLRHAVEAMAEADLKTRLRATDIAVRNVKEVGETNDVLMALARLPARASLPSARAELARFRGVIDALGGLSTSEDGRALARLVREMAAHYETVLLIRSAVRKIESRSGWTEQSQAGLADDVARVRQALEISAPLAEVRLAEARKYMFAGQP